MSAASTPLKAMLMEDHIAFRQALSYLLSNDPELEVVAQVGSLAEAREALEGGGLEGPWTWWSWTWPGRTETARIS